MKTRTIGLVLVAVALALVIVATLLTLANQAEDNGYVERLEATGMDYAEAVELVDAFEALDMSAAEIDDSIDQIEEIYQGIERMEAEYDANGLDADGCSAHERYDRSTGWCEPR
jgi:hypothetical protein